MKSLDQELSQGSFLILPITIIIGLIVYNYKRVRTSISSVYCCTWLSWFITARKRNPHHASQVTGGSASGGGVWLHGGICIRGGLSPGDLHRGGVGRAPPLMGMGYYRIWWSTSGQYASYWNAFLLTLLPPTNEIAGRRCFKSYLNWKAWKTFLYSYFLRT